jgi:hypothetical protein
MTLIARTMRKLRYNEAESGEIKLEACESFFRYRVHKKSSLPVKRAFHNWNDLFLE